MALHQTYKKERHGPRGLSLPIRVFIRILVIHVVVMYLCSWYVENRRIRSRMSYRVNRTADRLRVAALPTVPTKAGLKAVRAPTQISSI
jgi:hypothetical protein